MMEHITQANATPANLFTNFTPMNTIVPKSEGNVIIASKQIDGQFNYERPASNLSLVLAHLAGGNFYFCTINALPDLTIAEGLQGFCYTFISHRLYSMNRKIL